jgi:hypothetical protein
LGQYENALRHYEQALIGGYTDSAAQADQGQGQEGGVSGMAPDEVEEHNWTCKSGYWVFFPSDICPVFLSQIFVRVFSVAYLSGYWVFSVGSLSGCFQSHICPGTGFFPSDLCPGVFNRIFARVFSVGYLNGCFQSDICPGVFSRIFVRVFSIEYLSWFFSGVFSVGESVPRLAVGYLSGIYSYIRRIVCSDKI